mmetsp:Transcript_57569/g.106370  ORF Transcript_57569/g.106370 Transcript_57569/m.106370 type:complete len:239 (+) Transcript_57569:43-759(+)
MRVCSMGPCNCQSCSPRLMSLNKLLWKQQCQTMLSAAEVSLARGSGGAGLVATPEAAAIRFAAGASLLSAYVGLVSPLNHSRLLASLAASAELLSGPSLPEGRPLSDRHSDQSVWILFAALLKSPDIVGEVSQGFPGISIHAPAPPLGSAATAVLLWSLGIRPLLSALVALPPRWEGSAQRTPFLTSSEFCIGGRASVSSSSAINLTSQVCPKRLPMYTCPDHHVRSTWFCEVCSCES